MLSDPQIITHPSALLFVSYFMSPVLNIVCYVSSATWVNFSAMVISSRRTPTLKINIHVTHTVNGMDFRNPTPLLPIVRRRKPLFRLPRVLKVTPRYVVWHKGCSTMSCSPTGL